MSRWSDGLGISPRRLLTAALLTGVLIGVGVVPALARYHRSTPPPPPPPAAAPAPAPPPSLPVPSMAPAQVEVVDDELQGPPGALPLSPTELAAAKQVARDFALAFASEDFRQSQQAWQARLRPYQTDELAAQFATSSSGAAWRAENAANGVVTTAEVDSLTIQTLTRTRAVFTVVMRQTTTSRTGATRQLLSFGLALRPTPAGWRVAEVIF